MPALLSKQIADTFRPILGLHAWQVKKGVGSFLTLEFGEPHLVIDEPAASRPNRRIATIRGDWHLWIYCCGWTIDQGGEQLAHNEAKDAAIMKGTAQLDGQRLERLWLEPGTVITHFEFDLGVVLTTFPYNDDPEDEQWMLYEPSGNVLTLRADNRFSYVTEETPTNEETWLPLLSVYEG
jgi:hypothetical protein